MSHFKITGLLIVSLFSFSFSDTNIHKLIYYNSLIPSNIPLRKRVLTTTYCDDCHYLAKVENAGKVFTQDGDASYQLMHNGIKISKDCYYGDWMTVLIEILQGHHEPQEEKPFHEILKYMPKNAVMIELGSYWGYYSMWFGQRVTGAKNFLIEPDPKNIVIGQKNFKLNNMNGHFTQAMIGARTDDMQTFIDWDYNKHTIKQVCIDDFAIQHNIQFIHMLHSDIQGAEIDMLKGCQNLIAQKKIGYFFISTHRGTHQACLQILNDAHLEIMLSITREESFSADGLIVARLPEMNGPSNIEVSRRTKEFCDNIDRIIS